MTKFKMMLLMELLQYQLEYLELLLVLLVLYHKFHLPQNLLYFYLLHLTVHHPKHDGSTGRTNGKVVGTDGTEYSIEYASLDNPNPNINRKISEVITREGCST